MIPWFNLSRQYSLLKDEIAASITQVCEKTAFSGGHFVEKFEQEFAKYIGAEYVVALNSGTSALHLALASLDVGSGDEVILPANTFIATAWAVSYVGATPVFVDCDSDTWLMSVDKMREAITPKTKAVIGVHLYGQPCVPELYEVAAAHNLFWIEDCAQAHGALQNGRHVGANASFSCFSFYPGKNLGAYGEGGCVGTNDPILAARVQSLRNHGSVERYYHDELGYNMRMDGIQGAVLSAKLNHLPEWTSRRRQIAQAYQENLNPKFIKWQNASTEQSAFHLFVVMVDDRDSFRAHLENSGVSTGLHYPVPCHLQKAYTSCGYKVGDCPNAEALSNHCVTLPLFPELTDSEVEAVVDAVNSWAPNA